MDPYETSPGSRVHLPVERVIEPHGQTESTSREVAIDGDEGWFRPPPEVDDQSSVTAGGRVDTEGRTDTRPPVLGPVSVESPEKGRRTPLPETGDGTPTSELTQETRTFCHGWRHVGEGGTQTSVGRVLGSEGSRRACFRTQPRQLRRRVVSLGPCLYGFVSGSRELVRSRVSPTEIVSGLFGLLDESREGIDRGSERTVSRRIGW